MYVVIAGGGKIGQYLAGVLLGDGNDVAIIEKEAAIAKHLSEELRGSILIINGDGCETTVQESAGVHRADVFVAITGRDEDNLAACEIADRLYKVPRCVARVNNPKNLRIFKAIGIEPVSSTEIITRMVEEEATTRDMRMVFGLREGDIVMVEIRLPERMKHRDGAVVKQLGLDRNVQLIAVIRDGDFVMIDGKTRLMPGEKVIAAVKGSAEKEFRELVRKL